MASLKVGILLIATIGLAPIACDEKGFDDMGSRPYPSIETSPVTEVDANGARLNAEIISLGSSPIIDHGFVYLDDKNPSFFRGDRISLGAATSLGNFTALANRNLAEGVKYYARAYATTGNDVVFGPEVEFISLGGLDAAITDFLPHQGAAYDTIIITGVGFSDILNDNQVTMGSQLVDVVKASPENLWCVVPAFAVSGENMISLTVAGHTVDAANKFTMLTMVIDSFEPLEVTFGDTVSILGQNFTSYEGSVLAMLLGRRSDVISASPTKMEVVIANTVDVPQSEVNVKVGLQTVIAPTNIKLLKPVIGGFSPATTTKNSDVVINGNNFSSIKANNKVELNGMVLTVLEATRKILRVRIPAVTPGSYPVSVTIATQKVISQAQLEIVP